MEIEATQQPRAGAARDRALADGVVELPTLAVAFAIHGGFLLLTAFFHELPLMVGIAIGSVLLAWYGSLQHETIHGHPTPWRRINAGLGSLPLALWIPYSLYRETHLRHHRHGGRYLTHVGRDPETFYLESGALSRMGRIGRWAHRANCTLAGRMTLGPAIAILSFWSAEFRLVAGGDRRRLRIWLQHLAGVAVVLSWVVGVCRIPFVAYFALIVYPSVALTHLRSFIEHHDDLDSRLRTRVVEAHPAWALVFLNNNLHIAHHAYPKLPWYELPQVWQQMRRSAPAGLVFDGYREVARKYLLRPYITPDRAGG